MPRWPALRRAAAGLLAVLLGGGALLRDRPPPSLPGRPSVAIPGVGELEGRYASYPYEGVAVFLGVPFGAAARWRSPRFAEPWTGVRDAAQPGEICLQDIDGDGATGRGAAGAEDCLNLNVATPVKALAEAARANLPVLLWIHGGGYQFGSGGELPAEQLVRAAMPDGVVVVTVNYRLGPFGFLMAPGRGGPARRGPTPGYAGGSLGIEDQRLAMAWVQRHVGAFGGDAGRVTLCGVAAGGHAVLTHLVQRASWPFFHAAIVESGHSAAAQERRRAEAFAGEVFARLIPGAENNATGGDILDVYRRVLREASERQPGSFVGPVVDGEAMADVPLRLIQRGHHARVPVLIGSNRDELAIPYCLPNGLACGMPGGTPDVTEADFDEQLQRFLQALDPKRTLDGPQDLSEENVKATNSTSDPEVYEAIGNWDMGSYSRWWWELMRVETDFFVGHCETRRYARAFASPTEAAVRVHKYLVMHPRTRPVGSPDVGGDELAVGAAVVSAWVGFARSHQLPWAAHSDDTDVTLVFDARHAGGVRAAEHFRRQACDVWEVVRHGARLRPSPAPYTA